MKIAFDLDDTLIPCRHGFATERPLPCSHLGVFFPETLRKGSQTLLQDLRKQGHEIWLYTTSQRSSRYLISWFWLLGIPLGGIINQKRHSLAMRAQPFPINQASKYPPAFGIDVLIDDSEGVILEGQKFDFTVINLKPDHENWVDFVLNALETHKNEERNTPLQERALLR